MQNIRNIYISINFDNGLQFNLVQNISLFKNLNNFEYKNVMSAIKENNFQSFKKTTQEAVQKPYKDNDYI